MRVGSGRWPNLFVVATLGGKSKLGNLFSGGVEIGLVDDEKPHVLVQKSTTASQMAW